MIRWVEEILNRYGQTVTLRRAGTEEQIRAFLQPVAERAETAPKQRTPVGWLDGRLWLYLGRRAAQTGDTVVWKDMEFRVRSGRPVYVGEELSHWRAVLEREREMQCES